MRHCHATRQTFYYSDSVILDYFAVGELAHTVAPVVHTRHCAQTPGSSLQGTRFTKMTLCQNVHPLHTSALLASCLNTYHTVEHSVLLARLQIYYHHYLFCYCHYYYRFYVFHHSYDYHYWLLVTNARTRSEPLVKTYSNTTTTTDFGTFLASRQAT